MTRMHCHDRARRLLAEWTAGVNSGAERKGRSGKADAGEQEREELLEGIREGLQAGGMKGTVSLRLLRHLAAANN